MPIIGHQKEPHCPKRSQPTEMIAAKMLNAWRVSSVVMTEQKDNRQENVLIATNTENSAIILELDVCFFPCLMQF